MTMWQTETMQADLKHPGSAFISPESILNTSRWNFVN